MAIENEDLGAEEQTVDEAEKAREALAAAEKARQEAELARARAEGEAAALRSQRTETAPPAPAQLTEEQWQAAEAEYGISRDQIKANAKLFGTLAAPLQKAAKDAEERARQAEEKLSKLEHRTKAEKSLYEIESKFYAENPSLVGYKGDIGEFLRDYPEEMRNDPQKLPELLKKAQVYVRGKAGSRVDSRRRGERSERRTEDVVDDVVNTEDARVEDVDMNKLMSEMDNDGSKLLVARLARDPGDLSRKDPEDRKALESLYKSAERKQDNGVWIDSGPEFAEGERIIRGIRKGR